MSKKREAIETGLACPGCAASLKDWNGKAGHPQGFACQRCNEVWIIANVSQMVRGLKIQEEAKKPKENLEKPEEVD